MFAIRLEFMHVKFQGQMNANAQSWRFTPLWSHYNNVLDTCERRARMHSWIMLAWPHVNIIVTEKCAPGMRWLRWAPSPEFEIVGRTDATGQGQAGSQATTVGIQGATVSYVLLMLKLLWETWRLLGCYDIDQISTTFGHQDFHCIIRTPWLLIEMQEIYHLPMNRVLAYDKT